MIAQILDDIEHVDRAEWDALGRGSFYASHAWMRYQQMDPHSRAYYVFIRDDDRRPVAATAVYLVERESNAGYDPTALLPGLGEGCRRPGGRLTVLVGNRRGYSNRLLIAAGADRPSAVRSLADAVEQVVAECSADRAWWLYVDRADAESLVGAANAADPALLTAGCAITLAGDRFADYLASVPPSVRKRVRRDRRTFAAARYDVASPSFADCWPSLSPLVTSHENHHGHVIDADTVAGLLRVQAETVGQASHVHMCSRDGRAVACAVGYSTREEVAARFYGFDHTQPAVAQEYFELAYYRLIETAYHIGASRLHLGIGTLRTKIRRGAVVTPLWAVATGIRALTDERDLIRAHNERRWAGLLEAIEPYRGALADGTSVQPCGAAARDG